MDEFAHNTRIIFEWNNFKYNKTNVFSKEVIIRIELEDYYYSTFFKDTTTRISAKSYTEVLSKDEIEMFVNKVGSSILKLIKKKTE